jgi:GntR family transcriptional regulator
LVEGEPVQLCDGYYPRPLAQGTVIEQGRKIRGGVHAVLDDPDGPIRRTIARFIEDLEVRMPTPYEVELLRIPPGVPVARILRTAIDMDQEPIEVFDSIVPCDRHVFRYVIDVP